MIWLETRRWDSGTSDQDRADLEKARDILDRVKTIAAFYNPNQARDARGRWTSLDVQKAVAHLVANALDPKDPSFDPRKLGHCATKVREAIEAGGIVFDAKDRPKSGSSKDYGDKLKKYGFSEVVRVGDHRGYPPKGYTLEAGDVVVIKPGAGTSPHGHMAMFSGHQWISDFRQSIRPGNKDGFWPGDAYREQEPRYVIYRHKNKE